MGEHFLYQFATLSFTSLSATSHLPARWLQNATFRMIFRGYETPTRPSAGAAWSYLQRCIKTDPFSAQAGRGVDSAPAVKGAAGGMQRPGVATTA